MGQVYRATDTTLGRQVAIKILPDALAADPDRLGRFEHEAKTLASLNHPHIAAIYGFEKSAGTHALVMELVEGDDLSQKLAGLRAKGLGLPIDEALSIAKQIAEALEAARARDRPSRSETGEHQSPSRRHGEGLGLRPRESDGARLGDERERDDLANALGPRHAGGDHPGHSRVHEPRTGGRQAGGQTQ